MRHEPSMSSRQSESEKWRRKTDARPPAAIPRPGLSPSHTVTFARRRTLKQVLKFGHACAELWDSAMDLGNTRLIVSILAGGGEMGVGVAAQ